MAVLLIGMSIMAIMMTVAMPTWRQLNQREKEAELVFRGEQYARAIGLFQRKNGPGMLPANLDVLVDQRFLRKKYKDPITNEDFLTVSLTQSAQAGQPGQPGACPARASPGKGRPGGGYYRYRRRPAGSAAAADRRRRRRRWHSGCREQK